MATKLFLAQKWLQTEALTHLSMFSLQTAIFLHQSAHRDTSKDI